MKHKRLGEEGTVLLPVNGMGGRSVTKGEMTVMEEKQRAPRVGRDARCFVIMSRYLMRIKVPKVFTR